MREQSSIFETRTLSGALAALALLFSVFIAAAGEPIQFSNDKARSTPGSPQQRVDPDAFKSGNKSRISAGSPLNSLTPFITPGTANDPKHDKKLQNVQDEKRNWMLLEPGELQKREEEEEGKFGGSGLSMDNLDDRQDRNYLFYNAGQQKSENAPRQQNGASDSDDEPRKNNRSVLGSREAEKQGAHTSSELNLKNLINPSQVNAAKFNNNEASLFQFLKESSTPAPDKDQQARRDNFRDFINGPQGGSTPSGMSDPINFRTDLTQERLNPIMPRAGFDMSVPKGDSFSGRAPLPSGFTPGRAAGLPEMISSQPRLPWTANSLPSPLAIQNDASKTPRASVMGNGSLFNRDGPRRGGL
jgi:hypothetical protein